MRESEDLAHHDNVNSTRLKEMRIDLMAMSGIQLRRIAGKHGWAIFGIVQKGAGRE